MTTVLVREVLKAVHAGKRSDNGFKMEVWNEICSAVHRVAPEEPLSGDKCQGRLETLRKKWNVWCRLRGLSGLGWDAARGVYTAPDWYWEQEIKV
jgi:hypothetical protein